MKTRYIRLEYAGTQLAWGRVSPPLPYLRIKISATILENNSLIVSIYDSNFTFKLEQESACKVLRLG